MCIVGPGQPRHRFSNPGYILVVILKITHESECIQAKTLFLLSWLFVKTYRQVSNIRRTKSQHLKKLSCCLAAFFAKSLEARCQVENEDVVWAAPTGDAPITSEWSTILLPTKAPLILEVLRYIVAQISLFQQVQGRNIPSGHTTQL